MPNDSTIPLPEKTMHFGCPRELTTTGRRKRAEYLATASGWICHYCQRGLTSCEKISRIENADVLFGHGVITYCQFREMMQGLDPDPRRFPTLDHKLPQSKGGTHEIDNLVLCCPSCNSKKGFSKTYAGFRAEQKQKNADQVLFGKALREVVKETENAPLSIRERNDKVEARFHTLKSEAAKEVTQ